MVQSPGALSTKFLWVPPSSYERCYLDRIKVPKAIFEIFEDQNLKAF